MNPLVKLLLKKAIEIILLGALLPEAEKYVKQTSNQYDDKAVQFLKELIENLLTKIK